MRLIDADALLKGIEELKQSPWYENFSGRFFRKEAVEIIEDLCIKEEPTIDAVEVVRCENCKWCYDGYCSKFDDLIPFGHESYEWQDYYCSYGERREESEVEGMTMEEAIEILRDTPSSVIRHYCKDKEDMCEYANENGYCRLTACAYRWVKQNESQK